MSEERKTVQVGIAEKGTAPDGVEVREAVKPDEDEVGGRSNRNQFILVVCPYCFMEQRIIITEDGESRKWFKCWNCHTPYVY